jgi:cobalt/nickel transport protein
MSAATPPSPTQGQGYRFFDGFTRTMLAIMGTLLLAIFISGNYMAAHKMTGAGTDDRVNNLASATSHGTHHPFAKLPGDAELGAFSVANFFAGLIVGYHWVRLFGAKPPAGPEQRKD